MHVRRSDAACEAPILRGRKKMICVAIAIYIAIHCHTREGIGHALQAAEQTIGRCMPHKICIII
jgi:hypothetical protein